MMRYASVVACLATGALVVACGSTGQGPSDASVDVGADAHAGFDGNPFNLDSGDAAETSPQGPFAPLGCGTVSCNPPGDVCCLRYTGGEDSVPYWDCEASSTCTGAESVACWSAANCGAGNVCCRSAPTSQIVTSCSLWCSGADLQLCASSAECPSGQQCLTDPGGWNVCDTRCIDGENVGLSGANASGSGTLWLAYQYTAAASYTMSSIRLYTDGRGGDAGVGSAALLDSVQTDASAYQPGAVLATGTLPVMNALQWDTATLDVPVSVVAGHVYFIAQLALHPSMPYAGTSTVAYNATSLTGPWSGPFASAILVQTCQ